MIRSTASAMGETKSYTGGSSTVHFTLDGIACSMAICYDVRFCELIRTEALQGVDSVFPPCRLAARKKGALDHAF